MCISKLNTSDISRPQKALQEKLVATEKNMKQQRDRHQAAVDELQKEVKDTKSQLTDSQAQCVKLEGALKEVKAELKNKVCRSSY